MIRTRTAFVLGDGALEECGFPSDRGVIQLVCSQLDELRKKEKTGKPGWLGAGFRSDLLKAAPFFPSIGRMLECNESWRETGKLCLILATLNSERDFLIAAEAGTSDPNWLELVVSKMIQPSTEILKNEVSFINFAYDRLVEKSLVAALGYVRSSAEETARMLQKTPIIHTYGKVAELKGSSNADRHYIRFSGVWDDQAGMAEWDLPGLFTTWEGSKDEGRRTVRNMEVINWTTHNILVYGEDKRSAEEFSMANEVLRRAERIYLICRNYDELNLERLGVHELKGKEIVGTDLGLGEGQKRDLSARWSIIFPGRTNSVLEFLKSYVSLS